MSYITLYYVLYIIIMIALITCYITGICDITQCPWPLPPLLNNVDSTTSVTIDWHPQGTLSRYARGRNHNKIRPKSMETNEKLKHDFSCFQ
jgi:hypothetical protein